MSVDKKHRLVSLIWDSTHKSIDACRNYSSISQLVLRLIFAALLASCVLLIFILVSHLSMNKRKIDDENRMLVCSFFWRSRSIDQSIPGLPSLIHFHTYMKGYWCLWVKDKDKRQNRSFKLKHKMMFVIEQEWAKFSLSIRWPWGADIIFNSIEIEYKQLIILSLKKHR